MASAALHKEIAENSTQDSTSTSGIRALGLSPEDTGHAGGLEQGRHLRGIVITPERAPEEAAGPRRDGAAETLDLGAFQVEFAHDTQFFAGLSHDMSRGGILVVTYRELPVGTRVHLDFELPGGIPVTARGEVRSIREDSPTIRRGLAIAFTEIAESALRGISEFCLVYPPLFLDLDS